MAFPVEVMSVGTWNKTKFTIKDLKEIAKNFGLLKEVIKPPIKLGHSGDQTGKPALGWVTDLKVQGEKLVAYLDNIPEILMKAIQKKLYRRVSSEIIFGFKYNGKKYGRVFSGLALLGAEMPAVKDLEDLTAFLTQTSEGEFEKIEVFVLQDNNPKKESEYEMDPKQFQEQLDKLNNKITEFTVQLKDKEQKIKSLEGDLAKRDADAKKFAEENLQNEVSVFCEAQVKAGVMLPAQRDLIIGDKAVGLVFADGSVAVPFEAFKKFVEGGEKKRDDQRYTQDDDRNKRKAFKDPQVEVDKLAVEYMEKSGEKDYGVAMEHVLSDPENKKLAKAYTDDFQGVNTDEDE